MRKCISSFTSYKYLLKKESDNAYMDQVSYHIHSPVGHCNHFIYICWLCTGPHNSLMAAGNWAATTNLDLSEVQVPQSVKFVRHHDFLSSQDYNRQTTITSLFSDHQINREIHVLVD